MSRFAQLRSRYGLALVLAFGLMASVVAQPPAMPSPAPGGGGGMMFRGGPPDPEMIWGFMGGTGKESINLNERPDIKSRMERSGDPIPPDGILTKAAFKESFAKKMAAGGGMGGGRGPGGGGFGGGPGGGGMSAESIEGRFKDSDKNKDGFLTMDEASDSLKRSYTQSDKNGDGKISLDEYKLYISERFGGGMGGMSPGSAPQQVTFSQSPPPGFTPPPAGADMSSSRRDRQVEEDTTRVSVSRYGKIPKEVDSWFVECDDDKDGMVGLYEWRSHKKPTAEFLEHDLNADGYLTADEVLRHKRRMIEGLPSLKSVSAASPPSSSSSRGPSRGSESESSDRTKGGKGDRNDRGRPEKSGKPNPFEVRK
ncbi:MAG: hypothetical protein ACRC8S_07230 [Fimbriiglobus sp.]